MNERDIQRAILDYLAARHIFAIRINSGTQIGNYKGKKWAIHMAAPGTADILAFPRMFTRHNRLVKQGQQMGELTVTIEEILPTWLEVKTEKGKQSDLQKSFQAQVEAEGHRYAVCRSIAEVEAALI